jgi:hypothetical protein
MSRVTAPAAKLSRTLSAGAPTHNAGAVLMPKYAELLRSSRGNEHQDSSRGLSTTHRPTPQPSIANRAKPLMQTFHTSRSSAAVAAAPSSNLDAAVLPSMEALAAVAAAPSQPIVPILPDNYAAAYAKEVVDAPIDSPEVTIVAADPDRVLPSSPFSEVASAGLDSVSLGFAHESRAGPPAASDGLDGGMIRDIWKGFVEDVLGEPQQKKLA